MKKNILIIVSRLLEGGIDTVLVEFLRNLDRERYNITLAIGICMGELEVYRNDIPGDVKVVYLVDEDYLLKIKKQKRTGKVHALKKIYDELILSGIRRYIQQVKIKELSECNDIILDFDSTFYSFLKKITKPKICIFHFSFRRYYKGNHRKLKRLGRKLDIYDRVVTICDEMNTEAKRYFPHLKDKLCTIYNAFDLDTIYRKSLEDVKSDLIKENYIVAVQRLEESQKDATTLINAYKLLYDSNRISEKLLFLGDGRDKERLVDYVKSLGLSERILFLGKIKNPYPWMRNSKLFVLSSKFEGFGVVLIEAMSLGKVIVSTNCPTGPEEILDRGNAGTLVPVGNAEMMAEAIYKSLNDKEYIASIKENTKKQVEKFEIKRTMIKYYNLFDSLLS